MDAEGSISITWKLDDNAEPLGFSLGLLNQSLWRGGGGGEGVGREEGEVPASACAPMSMCLCVPVCFQSVF